MNDTIATGCKARRQEAHLRAARVEVLSEPRGRGGAQAAVEDGDLVRGRHLAFELRVEVEDVGVVPA
eukprot:scaffold96866_cov37-Prasinocladus_malaysianus.AAC.1